MNATYLITEDIEDATLTGEKVITKLDELSSLNSQIEANLQSDKWRGLTNVKCLCTHKMIVEYLSAIDTLLVDLKTGIYELDKNAGDFETVSDMLKSLSDI